MTSHDKAAAMSTSPSLLTAEAIAEMLGMTPAWVYSESRAGRIPHVKLGRYVRFRLESVEAWIADLEARTLHQTTKRPRTVDAAGGMAQRS